jgi:hypothetical protein
MKRDLKMGLKRDLRRDLKNYLKKEYKEGQKGILTNHCDRDAQEWRGATIDC